MKLIFFLKTIPLNNTLEYLLINIIPQKGRISHFSISSTIKIYYSILIYIFYPLLKIPILLATNSFFVISYFCSKSWKWLFSSVGIVAFSVYFELKYFVFYISFFSLEFKVIFAPHKFFSTTNSISIFSTLDQFHFCKYFLIRLSH